MKERFIQRYKNAIKDYFEYPGNGEGKRAKLYILNEYEKILEEEFNMTHLATRELYDKLYWECIEPYLNSKKEG